MVARELDLGDDARSSDAQALPDDELERLARNRNVLAALLEAALAALFLEHGFEPIEPAIVAAFSRADRVRADAARRPQDRAAGGARPAGRGR